MASTAWGGRDDIPATPKPKTYYPFEATTDKQVSCDFENGKFHITTKITEDDLMIAINLAGVDFIKKVVEKYKSVLNF